MIATRESVREVGGLTQSSTCSHSITSSLSYSLLEWCHYYNYIKFDNNLKIITTSPFLNVQLALTSVSSSRTSLTYERGCRAGMGNVRWQTRRGDLKLNSTASADFDKPYLPFLLSGSSQADEEDGHGTCGGGQVLEALTIILLIFPITLMLMLKMMAMMLKTRRPDQGWQWQESRAGFADHSM